MAVGVLETIIMVCAIFVMGYFTYQSPIRGPNIQTKVKYEKGLNGKNRTTSTSLFY
jgi:hypothetical protein